jgi:putative ABC transport system substrate-binding protein
MNRRYFITLLGGAAAWPHSASAQQSAMPIVGFLNSASPRGYAPYVAAFRRGLEETGYVEGRNVAIEYRWAEGQHDRLPAMAAEMVSRKVSVIVANTPAWAAAKAATTTIPISFTTSSDPVKTGLVASLNRPGGNITGVTQLGVEVAAKRLQLMHELVPTATHVALLVNPASPQLADPTTKNLQAATRALGLHLHVLGASTLHEIDAAFVKMTQLRIGALVIGPDPYFNGQSERLAEVALRHAIPAIFQYRAFVAAGGLMSYAGSISDSYRLIGVYAGRILKGEKPADLPVQQSTKVELIINLKTAKALGITFPLSLLGRADEVIE